MRIKRLTSHPDFRLEGMSEHFQSCWELELRPGEETSPRRHYESEELLYLVDGLAVLTIETKEHQVASGEVVLIPPRSTHKIRNPSHRIVRAISVESRLQGEPSLFEEQEGNPEGLSVLDEALFEIPKRIDEGLAIQSLVEIFNIGSRISSRLEKEIYSGVPESQRAMDLLERRVMDAVLEITKRYERQ